MRVPTRASPCWMRRRTSPFLRRACDGVRRYGGKLFFQLSHSGIKGVESVNGAPPKHPEGFTREELDRLVEQFAFAAKKCKESGADGVQVHNAHEAEGAVLSGRAHLRAGLCRKAQKRRAGREQMPCLQRLLHDLPQALCALRAASRRDRAVQNHSVVKKNGRAGAFAPALFSCSMTLYHVNKMEKRANLEFYGHYRLHSVGICHILQ